MTEITPFNLVRHELIGLDVRVLRSLNKQLVGLRGRIIDETRNTLTLKNGDRRVTIPKDVVHLRVGLPKGEMVDLDCNVLIARPEDRIKMRVRRW
jgi:ribonuclease P protein subunit POP4